MAADLKYLDYQGVVTLWAHIKQKLDEKADASAIASVYKVKGSCTTAQLATKTDAKVGDVWNLTDAGTYGPAGMNVVCSANSGSAPTWDSLGATYDLSGYLTKTEAASTYAGKTHDHVGTDVKLTGYSKASSAAAVAATDTVNAAIGKLEKALDGKKPTQTAVSDPTASTTATSITFIDTITQNTNGVISPTKKTVSSASTSAAGLMSAADKTKLDGIASGAQANQNAFSNVKVGSTTVAADSATDTLELVAGTNITLTPDATNDKVTITASIANNALTTSSVSGTVTGSSTGTAGVSGTVGAPTVTISKTTVTDALGYTPLQTNAVTSVNTKTGAVVLGGADVALTNYSKASTASAVAATDSVNAAIGKLEKALDGKQASGSYVQYTSQTLNNTQKSQARSNIGAGTSNLTIGTGASNAAAGNHTHSNYLTGNQTITLSGAVTGSGTTAITTSCGGSIASGNTGAVTGGAIYTALAGKQDAMTAITTSAIDTICGFSVTTA